MNEIKSKILKTENVNWKKLKPIQPENFKELPAESYKKLKNSLIKNQFIAPFAVWQDKDGAIYTIDGIHRQRILNELEKDGFDVHEALPANFIECKNRKEAAKLLLVYSSAYAKTTQEGLTDFLDLEGLDFQELKAEIDIPTIDLDKFEISLKDVDEEKLDDVPEPQKEAISKLGDIFLIDGKHRVMCGDSTNSSHVEALMAKSKADMVFTDPPYNVSFNGRSGKFDIIKNDNLTSDEFANFISKVLNMLEIINPQSLYLCCNWAFYDLLLKRIKPSACIVWAKNVFGLGKGYRHQHEFILFKGFINAEIKNETDLWNIAKDTNYKHPTQKPIQLPIRAINNSSRQDDKILDLFLGSGSTLIASEQTNRICYGMELDPIYIDVILRRYKNLYPDAKFECLTREFDFEKLWQN